ncbi:MAG: ABC transporter permease [Erysipelotrichaceae bacterium]|nr:ABC transporter permease [Erysipelotrichaceae bacterium]
MLNYILKRFLLALFTIWIVITITFFIMHAVPGGPFLSEKAASPETTAALQAKYGLDKPILEQYFNYLSGVIKFDFGPSLKYKGITVTELIVTGFKTSAFIGGIAALIAILIGVFLGSIAAVNHKTKLDQAIMFFSTAFVALPSFITASILLLVFCVKLQWFPANGLTTKGLILPIISLSLSPMSYITRLTRSSTLDVMGQDYIRTAKAKGVNYWVIIFKHSLRNALTPVITYIGPMLASVLTGSLVVEKIFTVAGIGKYFVSSIVNRDYMMIMGTTIFLTTIVIIMLFLTDIMYKIVNPRVDLE